MKKRKKRTKVLYVDSRFATALLAHQLLTIYEQDGNNPREMLDHLGVELGEDFDTRLAAEDHSGQLRLLWECLGLTPSDFDMEDFIAAQTDEERTERG